MLDLPTPDQLRLCARFGVTPFPTPGDQKVGIARNVREGIWPVHGLRHPPEGGTCGWYLWAGDDIPEDPDFFLPLHAHHLHEWRPEIVVYLALPPGWRFRVAPGYEDVYEDDTLLVL
jgi:hypothetical protein